MPEYFSGDASNNNMASSIVAGSPFVVAVEGTQLEWAAFERAVAMKVLELCVESGRLTPDDIADIDVKAIPPAVVLANREEEEKLRQIRYQAGVLSKTTWQQQVGLDPKHEAANFAAEEKRKAGGEGDDDGKESSGHDGKVAEARNKLVPGRRKLPGGGTEKHLVKPSTLGTDGWEPVESPPGATSQGKKLALRAGKKHSPRVGAPAQTATADGKVTLKPGGRPPVTNPDRVLTKRDRRPPRLVPRRYGPEAGERPPANWGKHIQNTTSVAAPPDMPGPHGHHIQMKRGKGSQQKWVELGIDILEFYDISWFLGKGHMATWCMRLTWLGNTPPERRGNSMINFERNTFRTLLLD